MTVYHLRSIWLVATYSWYAISPDRQTIKELRRYTFRLKKAYVRISKTTAKPRVQHLCSEAGGMENTFGTQLVPHGECNRYLWRRLSGMTAAGVAANSHLVNLEA